MSKANRLKRSEEFDIIEYLRNLRVEDFTHSQLIAVIAQNTHIAVTRDTLNGLIRDARLPQPRAERKRHSGGAVRSRDNDRVRVVAAILAAFMDECGHEPPGRLLNIAAGRAIDYVQGELRPNRKEGERDDGVATPNNDGKPLARGPGGPADAHG